MRLPNGYGGVTKLSGKRRKPWIARVTLGWDLDCEKETVKQNRKVLGSYATKAEALKALSEYNKNPYDISSANMTAEELYEKWTDAYFKTLTAKGSERTIKAAWKYCSALYKMPVREIRARHIKGAMEDGYIIMDHGPNKGERVEASPEMRKRIKSLFNLMLDYALEYEIVERNYARTFDIPEDIIREAKQNERGHINMTDEELKILWDHSNERYVDWILIQCYMGWRPQELARIERKNVDLDNMTITGGMKTDSGRNRIVPIHPKIQTLVLQNLKLSEKHSSNFLFVDPYASRGDISITYDKYAKRFNRVMSELGLSEFHRPHDPRTTFVTMAKKYGVDEYVIKRLIGHQIDDITERVYTNRDIEWLRKELAKIL